MHRTNSEATPAEHSDLIQDENNERDTICGRGYESELVHRKNSEVTLAEHSLIPNESEQQRRYYL